uniref:glutathione transferase n=1 Tax=Phocoena sinus TaxID=42100 RepID=A0A8C9C0M5_PHOSS
KPERFLGGQGRWKIRLAHAIRLLLDGCRGAWWPNRPGLLFLQLPYLIDGAHRLTQSNTILCYIARMYNMCEWSCGWGRGTGGHKIRVDVLENQVMDVRLCMAMICYSSDFEKLKPDYLKEIPKTMKLFSDFLGKRPWFFGAHSRFAFLQLTYVHFLVYDILDMHRTFEPRCLDEFPNLKDFTSRFEVILLTPLVFISLFSSLSSLMLSYNKVCFMSDLGI